MAVRQTVAHVTEADDGDLFLVVLDEAMHAVRGAEIPFLLIGGIGSAVFGRDQDARDIDLLVRPTDARRALETLGARGFETRVANATWLFKAFRHGVQVDVIFRSSRDIVLDDEMLSRARSVSFRGRRLPIALPEDLVVMKACATGEDTQRYWYDALAIVAQENLDWDYVVRRARQYGARRILSLMLFAASIDLAVPMAPIEELVDSLRSGSRT